MAGTGLAIVSLVATAAPIGWKGHPAFERWARFVTIISAAGFVGLYAYYFASIGGMGFGRSFTAAFCGVGLLGAIFWPQIQAAFTYKTKVAEHPAPTTTAAAVAPKVTYVDAPITFDDHARRVSTSIHLKNWNDARVMTSAVAHLSDPARTPDELMKRVLKMRQEAEALLRSHEFPLPGGVLYDIPLGKSDVIEPEQYAALRAGKMEYTWGVFMLARNEAGTKKFWFCGQSDGLRTVSSPCPIIAGDE